MHPGFLTECHDLFQTVIFIQPQSNGNLIQTVLRKDHHKVCDPSQDLYTFIFCSGFHMIIQNSPYLISPLGIGYDPVDIFFRRMTIPHKKDMLQIIALFPHTSEKIPDQIPQSGFQKDIYKIKNRQQFSGKMHHLYQIQYPQDQRDSYGIRFDNVPHFQPSSLHPLRSIQAEQIIQQQIYRYNRQYCRRIDPERKCSHTPIQKQKFNHPCNKVGDYDHKSIQCHMQAVKMLLVFFNQGLITLCSNM